MKEYKFKHTLGTLGDMTSEWWTEEDWKKWKEYCEQLRKEGRFGEEVEYTYLFNSELEEKWWDMMRRGEAEPALIKESFKFIIFDVSNEENTTEKNV